MVGLNINDSEKKKKNSEPKYKQLEPQQRYHIGMTNNTKLLGAGGGGGLN